MSTVAERIRAKVEVDEVTGCHLWMGALNESGYPVLHVGGHTKGAHRLAWEAVHGPIPDKMWCLPRCGERSCCRVEHHYLRGEGTKERAS